MALSATITLTQSSIGIHGQVVALIAVTNSAGVPVTVMHLTPTIVSTGNSQTQDATCCTFGRPRLGPNTLIAASGTSYFSFPIVVNAPQSSVIGPQADTFSVSCSIYGSDGSVVSPTAASLTITPIP